MLNRVVIVGKVEDVSKEEGIVLLEVERNFKNPQGIYEVDRILVNMPSDLNDIMERIDVNDLIGIKGRIQTDWGRVSIVAEKVSFLSSGV